MNGPLVRGAKGAGGGTGGTRRRGAANLPSPLHLRTSSFSLFQNSSLNVDTFIDAPNVNIQLDFIKNLAKIIKLNEDTDLRDESLSFIIVIFLDSPLKHPLKNTCLKLLSSLQQHSDVQTKTYSKLMERITCCKFDNIELLNNVCNAINSCIEIFPPCNNEADKNFTLILNFLKEVLKTHNDLLKKNNEYSNLSPTMKTELFLYIHNASRILISILQKNNSLDNKSNNLLLVEVSGMCNYLLDHPELPMDTKGNCAMILIFALNYLFGSNTWTKVLKTIFLKEKYDDIHCLPEKDSEILKLVIPTAVINIISLDDLCSEEIDKKSAFLFICTNLISLSEICSADSTIILGLTRGIQLLSKLLSKVQDEIAIEASCTILTFVWSHLDYYVDSVRHLTTQILSNVVKLAVFLDKKGNQNVSSVLINTVIDVPSNQALNFKALISLGSDYSCSYLLEKNPNLPTDMLSDINFTDSSNISTAFEVLMMKHCREVNLETIFDTWITPVLKKLLYNSSTCNETSSTSSTLAGILLRAVKLDSQILPLLISSILKDKHTKITDGKLKCMLVCLNVARKSGYFDLKYSTGELWKDVISFELLNMAVKHQVAEIRILGYAVIVESHKSTEYFEKAELDVVENFLKYNINTKSPSVHQNILAITRKLLDRWQNGYVKSARQTLTEVNNETSDSHLMQPSICSYYETFLTRVCTTCMKNIFPGANFSRKNLSMQILIWAQDVYNKNQDKLSCSFWKEEDIPLLFSYLEDSYECNKQLAMSLLILTPITHNLFNSDKTWNVAFIGAISKASNVKPTDCMSAAYRLELLTTKYPCNIMSLYEEIGFHSYITEINFPYLIQYNTMNHLLELLKKEESIAKESILDAAANGPMYGLLYCIRHLLGKVDFKLISRCNQWRRLINDAIRTSFTISEAVKPIVNNSSPEGHLPMDFNAGSSHVKKDGVQLENGKPVTAQMVLLCAWRSIKEVSLLLGDISHGAIIIENASECDAESIGTITKQHLLDIGDHFITLLSETKHRGAFEQAYVGFSKLCKRLWKCDSKDLHDLPHLWLNDLITAISSGNSKNSKLCATRRSAGVPFIIQALVTTELQSNSSPRTFQKSMSTMLQLAKFDGNDGTYSVERRTHCLNILRALFRHAVLGEYVNMYVADALIISINGFDGATWAERNSSTLLFSSLMTRVFGVQRTKDSDQLSIRNKMTGRIFFLRYPKLYDFFLDCLKSATEHQENMFVKPSLYPVLLLLSRLYPSSLEGTDSNLQLITFVPYLTQCSGNCVLKIRKLAAKAIVPLISLERYFSHLIDIFKLLIKRDSPTNFQHGILLQLVRLLQFMPQNFILTNDNLQSITKFVKESCWILVQVTNSTPCFVILDTYLEVLLLLLNKLPEIVNIDEEFFKDLQKYLFQSDKFNKNKISLGVEEFEKKSIQLKFALSYLLLKNQCIPEICSMILQNIFHRSNCVIQVLLNYLVCFYNDKNIKNIEKKMDIGHLEKLFVLQFSSIQIQNIVNNINGSAEFKQRMFALLEDYTDFQSREKIYNVLSFVPDSIYSVINLPKDTSNDIVLNKFIKMYESEHEQINYVYLKCIDNYLHDKCHDCSVYDTFSFDNIRKLSLILKECSEEDNEQNKNVTIDIFINNWKALKWSSNMNTKIFEITVIQWSTIFKLLSDDNEIIANGMANLVNTISCENLANRAIYKCNENVAIEMLLSILTQTMLNISFDHSIAMLVILALGDDDSTEYLSEDEYLVFDKGEGIESNEECALTLLCLEQMYKLVNEKLTSETGGCDTPAKSKIISSNSILINWSNDIKSSNLNQLLNILKDHNVNISMACSDHINNVNYFKINKLVNFLNEN
ncbi:thyroid adenoma-associated protein homolog [Arctopsyche grandis]|uniref:thyroid adenoma-associated protein homolog n=1 Tax=Arctopsyche grandis TaxID=121162 RepID=UPI00406D84A2